mgnify:CR=1 FL=1
MKKSRVLPFLFFTFFSLSCSLNYLKGENSEDTIPEFNFKNADYTRYESSKKNIVLRAEELEQYKSDNAIFAKNASFETFDSSGKSETSGECDLIAANTKKDIYTLYGNIELSLPKQDMQISADSLNFNKKTEQLTSGKNSEVRLTKKDVTMSGYGFSASGVNHSFSFIDTVLGTIETNDKNDSEQKAGDTEQTAEESEASDED